MALGLVLSDELQDLGLTVVEAPVREAVADVMFHHPKFSLVVQNGDEFSGIDGGLELHPFRDFIEDVLEGEHLLLLNRLRLLNPPNHIPRRHEYSGTVSFDYVLLDDMAGSREGSNEAR